MEHRDACGVVARVRKDGRPTHGTLKRTLEALVALGHRGGEIEGEGDGAGVMVDLPRELWANRLARAGRREDLAGRPGFFVAHLMIPHALRPRAAEIKAAVRNGWAAAGLELLLETHHAVNPEALGPRAREDEPEFWQIAGLDPLHDDPEEREGFLEGLGARAEAHGVHVASVSADRCIYKVHGTPVTLGRYYPDLRSPLLRTASAVGHSRYSTNTLPTVLRAQPFGCLAHNGEINTIERLRREARALGAEIPPGGSDSQDLDRIVRFLLHEWGLSLPEAVELLFPPVHHEILHSPEVLRSLYAAMRRVFDASAQGPAALILRRGDEFVFSVDALGLRPLWVCETTREWVVTSEPGVVAVEDLETDPKPMAPGEKVAVRLGPGGAEFLSHSPLQKEVLARFSRRLDLKACWDGLGLVRGDRGLPEGDAPLPPCPTAPLEKRQARAGWDRHDLELLRAAARTGRDPVGSMGWDAPLAALDPEAANLADFLHEDVAVVTNPAIDPKREGEHFSTRVRLGSRVAPGDPAPYDPWVSVEIPILIDGIPEAEGRAVARRFQTAWIGDAVSFLGPHRTAVLRLARTPGRPLADDLDRLAAEARTALEGGACLLLLADPEQGPEIDPLLALATVDRGLRETRDPRGQALRRRASLVVASDALRNLHDCMCCLGLGAEAVAPRLLLRTAFEAGGEGAVARALGALDEGIRAVLSTMGIHEVSGYGRVFSAVGLSEDLAGRLGVRTRYGGRAGLTLAELDRRWAARAGTEPRRLTRLTPEIARPLREAAEGAIGYPEAARRVAERVAARPAALRHLLDLRAGGGTEPVPPAGVDPRVGSHSYPFFLCPMSFGSQGETAFRIYAEAGRVLGVPCMNGEGGELPDLLGRYRGVRSQQVASGRFGVHAEMLNSVDLIEIKIGQGAKPGEGGHLPGRKVTPKVALARSATPGIPLISPSNHHDIYSIEDLAQLIEELRMVNPAARIAVKLPVVSGIATIGLGVAKAGADIVTLSGFDGGTGAARLHALRRVGLPVEVGVTEVHRALRRAGLRHRVELWADGGLRTAEDAVKCLCLGADRVGFGTLALLGIGCIACRRCHLDRCPRGIATQVETPGEAERRGIRGFRPRSFEEGVENLTRLLRETGEEIRRIAGRLGVRRIRDLVGRTDLLVQTRGLDLVDLSDLLEPPEPAGSGARGEVTVRRPLSYLTRVVTQEVCGAVARGATAVNYEDDRVLSSDRALGTHLAGEAVRRRPAPGTPAPWRARLHLGPGSVPGNGLGAFGVEEVEIRVEGGSQDGVAKGSRGGKVVVLKGENHDGRAVGGCVGKGFAYGAQAGLFLVQGDADSRCGVRLSGADVVIGGRMREPRLDGLGFLADRANCKGFAFEYMTAGRAVVLGDPGPWLCSGMTGGVVYVRLDPPLGLDREALGRRIARGASVRIGSIGPREEADLRELLGAYAEELRRSPYAGGEAEARWVEGLLANPAGNFVCLRPAAADP